VFSLRSNCSSERHQSTVAPIVPRLRSCASKHPQPDSFVIDAKQVRKGADRAVRVREQSRRTIEQVLRRVVGGISDEGLWAMTSQGSRSVRRTLPACKSVANKNSMGSVRGNSAKRHRPSWTSPASGHRSM